MEVYRGAEGRRWVVFSWSSSLLCTMLQMVVQVEPAGEDGASRSLNLALHHVSNSVGFLFGPRK